MALVVNVQQTEAEARFTCAFFCAHGCFESEISGAKRVSSFDSANTNHLIWLSVLADGGYQRCTHLEIMGDRATDS